MRTHGRLAAEVRSDAVGVAEQSLHTLCSVCEVISHICQEFTAAYHHALCVQVSAGNQLFHVVVDNDDVATRITALLTEQRAGRVTFIPLNRINPQPVQYPDFGDDALPLVNKINCADQHKKAVAQASSSLFLKTGCRLDLTSKQGDGLHMLHMQTALSTGDLQAMQ